MHENPQVPGDDLARSKSEAPDYQLSSPDGETVSIRRINGATFDDSTDASASLSDLRKLQDASKFHKARFSFRLYQRERS